MRTPIKCLVAGIALLGSSNALAVQVFAQDVVVQGSLCTGLDCPTNPAFGFNTILLRENNLRIKFDDTSSTSSFPRTDWTILANETTDGGLNKFSIQDDTAAKIPFTIEGAARNNALYVDDGGRVGFGTSSPVVELHVRDGDTPTLRLEQDGSSGFTAQTWDMAGNETNFFIRDATNGSKLPFRVRPGAPTSALDIAASGNIGFGTSSPEEAVDVLRNNAAARFQVTSRTDTGPEAPQFIQKRARANGNAVLSGDNLGLLSFRGSTGGGSYSGTRAGATIKATEDWTSTANGTRMLFQTTMNGTNALTTVMEITHDRKVLINGNMLNVPDYVFEEDYPLMSLDELAAYVKEHKHLPGVSTASEVKENGLDMAGSQMSVLEKVEELTLYTLQQHEQLKEMDQLKAENARMHVAMQALQDEVSTLRDQAARVGELEQAVGFLLQQQSAQPVQTTARN